MNTNRSRSAEAQARESSRQLTANTRPLLLWLALGLCALGCSWEPIAREVAPQQLLTGPARVLRLLDAEGRNVLVLTGEGDDTRLRIVHMERRDSCELPGSSAMPAYPGQLLAPNLRGKDVPRFLAPLYKREGETFRLYYTDENCTLRGPFGETELEDPGMLTLDSDGRNVSLIRDTAWTLRLVDPWTGQTNEIADDVATYDRVQRGEGVRGPEALWLIEGGKLTQRALDGTLLLSLGSNVTAFHQALRDALRVAYVDDGNLFEAKGPDFTPVLIAEDACAPRYDGTWLDLHKPCAAEQLVRIDLSTGEITRFPPTVYRAYSAADVRFEQSRDDPDDPNGFRLWVSREASEETIRTLLVPRPDTGVSVISRQRLVGRASDNRFGIWTLSGSFTPAYEGVRVVQTFRDQRTNQLLWLMLYRVDANDVGTLMVVDQPQLERVVEDVKDDPPDAGAGDAGYRSPLAAPLVIADRVSLNGYRVYYPAAVRQPVILTLEPPITRIDEDTFTGTLHAHLLSNERASRIDDAVHTFDVVTAPIPGILYGILQGEKSGLWFAAL